MNKQIQQLLKSLSTEQKAYLCSGLDFWHTKSIEGSEIPSLTFADGPHGLRKQELESGKNGQGDSRKATCFPPACTTACSFNTDLFNEIGQAIADECIDQDISVVLGPAANIKRSPLCGRNFEYISEDPFLTGEMASAMINGVQSKGVGTSLKHFAANNQERARLICDSIVDERALREIYLAGFEKAVMKAKPWTIMCSYNLINGVYSCENSYLLNDILREQWGFQGLVMTDWAAMNNRTDALSAGLELEMPGPAPENDQSIVDAVNDGKLSNEKLNTAVQRIIELVQKSAKRPRAIASPYERNRALARRAFLESAVLLKNEGLLPARKEQSIAIIGAFAKETRFQGSGSSRIHPTRVANAFDGFQISGGNYVYEEGYSLSGEDLTEEKVNAALTAAKNKDLVIVFAGLPDEYESEGFDRTHMDLPDSHNQLIEKLAEENENIAVVLYTGSPVTMPWIDKVKAVLLAYLPGQEGAEAIPQLIYGEAVPCGKLAETFPLDLSDTPCFHYFGTRKSTEYRESIFVGYRYYDAANKEVLFPFGHGLSYSQFSYQNMQLSSEQISGGDSLKVSLEVVNTGNYDASEIVQIYVAAPKTNAFRAPKELRAFAKVFVPAGKKKKVGFVLENRAFSFYNVNLPGWQVISGKHKIFAGASSRDIRLEIDVKIRAAGPKAAIPDYSGDAPSYYNLPKDGSAIPREEFIKVYGRIPALYEQPGKGTYSLNSTLTEITGSYIGRMINKKIRKEQSKKYKINPREDQVRMMEATQDDTPLRSYVSFADGKITREFFNALLTMMNGNVFKGAIRAIREWKAISRRK